MNNSKIFNLETSAEEWLEMSLSMNAQFKKFGDLIRAAKPIDATNPNGASQPLLPEDKQAGNQIT